MLRHIANLRILVFQLTAARRRLAKICESSLSGNMVSTHSRPKAAGAAARAVPPYIQVSTHSRPKAAGSHRCHVPPIHQVSTHSRPKAAGRVDVAKDFFNGVSTHSRPKAAGLRLHGGRHLPHVSTHSRPKAAGKSFWDCLPTAYPRFNSQPPEGGWPPPIV